MKRLASVFCTSLLCLSLSLSAAPPVQAQPAAEPAAEGSAEGSNPQQALVDEQRRAGLAELESGDVAAALSSFRASLKLAREISYPPAIAQNLLSIGLIHQQAGRTPAAVITLERARNAVLELEAQDDLLAVELALSESYATARRFPEAYRALLRYQELSGDNAEQAAARVVELEAELAAARQQAEQAAALQQQQAASSTQPAAAEPSSTTNRLQPFLIGGAALALLLMLLTLLSRGRLKEHLGRVIADRDLELKQTSESLEQTTDQLTETEGELELTNRQLFQTRLDLDRINLELEQASSNLLEAHAGLDRKQFELNRAVSDREQFEIRLNRKTQDLDQASTLLERKAVQLVETSRELDQTRSRVEQQNQRLEQAVAELDQLRGSYAKDIAELGDRNADTRERLAEMESFTSAVSQHLKVLLISIRSSLGALQQDAAAGDMRQLKEDVNRTHDAVGRVVRLLDKLLKLLLVGRMSSAPAEVPMSELAYEAAGQVTGLVADRKAEIAIAPDMPTAYGDRAQLLEVLRNLLENSGKFIGEQPAPRIEVGWRRDPDGAGGSINVFFVRDNGIGIDPRDQERVFTLFERLDAQQEGVGLGLGLVKRIIDAHQGRIWVESEGQGQGSTFCFTVPDGP
ncbi:MAG: ATP-binding protein [Acidobacteriota bacterium]